MATHAQAPPELLAAAAATEPLAPDPAGGLALPPLPASIALQIFSLLTVEERLRAREVSRTWRNVPGNWRCVELQMDGWPPERCVRVLELLTKHVAVNSVQMLLLEFPDAILQADVGDWHAALLAVVNAHSATLRTLDVTFPSMELSLLDTMLERFPALESCRLGELRCSLDSLADVQRLAAVLKGDDHYPLVAVRALTISSHWFPVVLVHEAPLREAVQREGSLRKLSLSDFLSNSAAGALARAAARAGVIDFEFACYDVESEVFTREVAQVLNGFPVQRLSMVFSGGDDSTFDTLFVTALRNNRSLQSLEFGYAGSRTRSPPGTAP
jgi:hypothetical protein